MASKYTAKLSVMLPVEELEALKARTAETAQVYPEWKLSNQVRAENRFLRSIKFSVLRHGRKLARAVGEN